MNWCKFDEKKIFNLVDNENYPKLSTAEAKAVGGHSRGQYTHILKENAFVFNEGISSKVYITKVISDEFNHLQFITDVLDVINCPAFISIDYHGFNQCNGEPVFVFGSRNTSIVSNSLRNGYILKSDDDYDNLTSYFTNKSTMELLNDWFQIHAQICGFAQSDLVPSRLCCMYITLQHLDLGTPKFYE